MTQAFDLGAIQNQSRTSIRGRINAGFQAVTTHHSGPVAPSPSYAHMLWFDTSAGTVKLRDAFNTSWAEVGDIGPPFGWTATGTSTGVLESATLSGTSLTLTGIPSGVVAFDLSLIAVQASGTWNLTIRLGTSGGLVSSGYAAVAEEIGVIQVYRTEAFQIALSAPTNASLIGLLRFACMVSNRWVCQGISSNIVNAANNTISTGTVILPGTLDRVEIGTNSGGSFTNGIFQIRYFT